MLSKARELGVDTQLNAASEKSKTLDQPLYIGICALDS